MFSHSIALRVALFTIVSALLPANLIAITVTPSTVTVDEGATQQFTASTAATWKTTCGLISSNGLFTAPLHPGTCTVTATSTSNGTVATAAITLVSPITMTPAAAKTPQGQTQQFTATLGGKSVPVKWFAKCGTITPTGLFTATSPPFTRCTIEAIASTGKPYTVYGYDQSLAPTFPISPSSARVHGLGTQQYSASTVPVTWSSSCGSITALGLFTAPAAAGTCTITATSTNGMGTSQASATVTLANYTRWKNGAGGAGAETDEYLLTPANVSSGHFGTVWSAMVDGDIVGQPLYLNAIKVGGKVRNVVFIGTSNDTVYAFDGDSGAQLWTKSFLSPGVTAVSGPTVNCLSCVLLGILSTPAINVATGTLYVVAETSENNATYFPHHLHALDIFTGQEKFGGPVLISDPALVPKHKLQRPGLLLANGNVYVAFGSIGDRSPYHGLVFAFDQSTLKQKALFNTTPTGDQGAIWMSAAGLTADSQGNIYAATGNGTFDGINNFGEAAVKLSPDLQELDYFAPFDFKPLNAMDLDLGSGDVLVVPDQSGPFPHELIVCGKPTPIYVLNRDALGHVGTNSDHIIQRLDHQLGGTGNIMDSGQPCYTTPSIWKQNVYFVANHDVIKVFTLSSGTGLLSTTPVMSGSYIYDWPGSNPVISANGDANGIVWTMDQGTHTLRANDATDVSKVLFISPYIGSTIRWSVPTVINGHVYVGLRGKLVAYSLR